MKKYLLLTVLNYFFLFQPPAVFGQRVYQPNSVLSAGNWYKFSVKEAGIYKIDIAFLNSLGVSTPNLSSSSVKIYGNGGGMLPESCNGSKIDDLTENAIAVIDGGDGVINGADYILLYAPGPNEWVKDSANKRFTFKKNLYSDKSFYYLTIATGGKRIGNLAVSSPASAVINSFNERIHHELDTVNFLGSGKEWYGEEFSNIPGRTTTRDFNITIPGLQIAQPVTIISNCIARSIGSSSRFDVKINNLPVQSLTIPATGGGQYDVAAQQVLQANAATVSQNNLIVNYTYLPGSFNSQGWLNWFQLHARRNLSLTGVNQLLFRDWNSAGSTIGEFVIADATATTQVWDITDPQNPAAMQGGFVNNEFRFKNDCNRLREYAVFTTSGLLQPLAEGRIQNQNLHNALRADYLIVVHPPFLPEALRLAQFHSQKNNLQTVVVTTSQVYNEFSSGIPDPVAIRDFVKMYYDKAAGNPANRPKYLLLFGDASFDYKDRVKNNANFVPAYENNFSLDPLASYTSDDFFGFLDDADDINNGAAVNLLDIGIGRIPAKNGDEAKNYIDKIIAYYAKESFGPWRNSQTFIADDEDFNLHLQDAEIITATAAATAPVFNFQKIYLDAYRQESGSGGSNYPAAKEAVNNQVFNGTLVWNYNGHGGSNRLAEETILDQDIVNNWKNKNRLPLFITATCDFAPYDNPGINSLGENLLLRPETGAIALMTTTRVVFAFSNRVMNNNYLKLALEPDAAGKYKTLGDAVKAAKNFTYQSSGDITNNRKFTLLGDPALTLGFPTLKIRTAKINGITVPAGTDTLSAAEKVIIEGEVTDNAGAVLTDFNGIIYPTIYDKPQNVNTLANDAGSQVTGFSSQNNILFKGKASVVNGKFSFNFKVPKDINYQYGNGKISLYANDETKDANGFFTGFIIGGAAANADNDREGPKLKAFLNDEKFVNGGITHKSPVLLIKLSDSSGINTAGTGIGHDIVGTLDNDNRNFYVLNDFYISDLDNFQQGSIRFQLPEVTPGPHTLKIKAWDVVNNSNEIALDFTVTNDEKLLLTRVLNYPNPFTTKTTFWFEHNRPNEALNVKVQIFTVTGRLIKTLQQTINTTGNRSCELDWDGRDEYGDKIGKGVYVYKLSAVTSDRKKHEVIEKLVIF
jgi:Peptidase family C25